MNINRNYNVFIQENAFESVVCETAAILPRPQCVKTQVKCFQRVTLPGEFRSDTTMAETGQVILTVFWDLVSKFVLGPSKYKDATLSA